MSSLYRRVLLILSILLLTACQPLTTAPTQVVPESTAPEAQATEVDLSPIKEYLIDQAQMLKTSSQALMVQSERYYALAQAADFDYTVLWQDHGAEVIETLNAARSAWIQASPHYEKMEGIVAGTPTLAHFDVILDAGSSGKDDPENAVPFDLDLPDGRVLAQPGNLFGVTESTLWGTEPTYSTDVDADLDGDGTIGFGDTLPDANVLKAGADMLVHYSEDLLAAADDWEPTVTDAFTALVVMVPTMSEYFASWRDSRFVSGAASNQRDFVVISRLADVQDILDGLQVVYAQVRPLAESVDTDQATQIAISLSDLYDFVADIYAQEQSGKQFTPEEADILGAEAQNRATAITGHISQVAGHLGIDIES